VEQFNTPIEINGIVVEESLINGWPVAFSNCWINISPDSDNYSNANAELIMSDEHEEGAIIKSNFNRYPNCVSVISWHNSGQITYLWVSPDRRNQGVGYCMGLWLRAYLAVNFGVKALHPTINERNVEVESLIRLFKNTYNDEEVVLIEESNE
jgi:hypothetical protein